MIEYRNKIYDETILRITETQQKQNDYHNHGKEKPPILEPNQEVFNKGRRINSKTNDRFGLVKVIADRSQTYTDDKGRKLHKTQLRRIRK